MGTVNKIIKLAIAILAIIVCFQVIGVNGNKLLTISDDEGEIYQPKIVSTLHHEKSKTAYDGTDTKVPTPKS